MEIEVSQKKQVIQGTIKDGAVKLFGSAAHLILPKKEMGKKVKIVIPERPKYVWVFTEKERKAAVKECLNLISDSKLSHYQKGMIKNIQEDDFELLDIQLMVELLNGTKLKRLAKKIEKTYYL